MITPPLGKGFVNPLKSYPNIRNAGSMGVPYSLWFSPRIGMNMNHASRITVMLVLAAAAWPTFAADYFWNCTKPDGIKYADATQCDKGDTAVKVMKGAHAAPGTMPSVPSAPAEATLDNNNPEAGVCPTNPANCQRPDYGVTEASPRALAITQFMRKKQCEFLKKFPQRCAAIR